MKAMEAAPPMVGSSSARQGVDYMSYLTVGSLFVLTWDILNTLKRDLKLTRASKKRTLFPWLLLFASRATTLVALALDAAFQVFFTTVIILLRVKSAFEDDRYITGIFLFLQLSLTGALTTFVLGTAANDNTQPDTCSITSVVPYVSASIVAPLLYVGFAYILVSARLASKVELDMSRKYGIGFFIAGELGPALSKGLLKDGQAYYLLVIIFHLVSLILFMTGSSANAQLVLLTPTLALSNILTLRKEEKERRKKEERVILLPHVYDQGGGGSNPLASFSGIQVTKTIEQF
ncbi:hypothetical protein CPC08DRAFT_754797 [Agrocybe pediades]|nr:hypothetical protein CPC08DRAFT_754797 [Agrocybe pediades]